jgi:hypothetical protein
MWAVLVVIISGCAGVLTLLSACSRSNNLLLGRVEAAVGAHSVVVTDCYRTSVPPPLTMEDAATGKTTYRFTPCRDADVLIRGAELSVNGEPYGSIGPNDAILVDHGVVSINQREARIKKK